MKHIALHYHNVGDMVKKGQVKRRKIQSEDMIADRPTKGLRDSAKFKAFLNFLGLRSAKELETTIGKRLRVAEGDV